MYLGLRLPPGFPFDHEEWVESGEGIIISWVEFQDFEEVSGGYLNLR